jgi:alkylated DNA nucleotide flippase Atl1
MTIFTEKVISIIQSIPEGKIITYGQIAVMREAQEEQGKLFESYMQ